MLNRSLLRYLDETGTTLNYFLDDKINRAEILFPGVGCFLIAVCLGSAVHSSNSADNKEKLGSFSNDSKGTSYVCFFRHYSRPMVIDLHHIFLIKKDKRSLL